MLLFSESQGRFLKGPGEQWMQWIGSCNALAMLRGHQLSSTDMDETRPPDVKS